VPQPTTPPENKLRVFENSMLEKGAGSGASFFHLVTKYYLADKIQEYEIIPTRACARGEETT
jgi:hypothetical protein